LLVQLDRVVHRQELLEAIGGDQIDASNQLHSSIRRLRRRVNPLGLELRTVRAVGYVLELEVPPDLDPASGS
jgi:two-component system OmpR family response regulator